MFVVTLVLKFFINNTKHWCGITATTVLENPINLCILSAVMGQHLPLRHVGLLKLASNLMVSVPN